MERHAKAGKRRSSPMCRSRSCISPRLAHPDFIGRTGHGEFADSLAEMDYRVGQIDRRDRRRSASRDDTLFIFGSDNGPEFRRPWRGTAGHWRSTYHTAMEGSLRVPFMMRWPGKIPAGRVTNEIVHITDLYPTLAASPAPRCRPTGRSTASTSSTSSSASRRNPTARASSSTSRTNCAQRSGGTGKLHFVWEPEPNDGPIKLEAPYLFNLIQDPKEETDIAT